MSAKIVALALLTVLLYPIAGPTTTCASERQDCLQSHAQEGLYGSTYVSPDDVATCAAAYQACLNNPAVGSGATTALPPMEQPELTSARL